MAAARLTKLETAFVRSGNSKPAIEAIMRVHRADLCLEEVALFAIRKMRATAAALLFILVVSLDYIPMGIINKHLKSVMHSRMCLGYSVTGHIWEPIDILLGIYLNILFLMIVHEIIPYVSIRSLSLSCAAV